MDWLFATEGGRLFQCGIVRGKRNSSGHHCMSGVCSIDSKQYKPEMNLQYIYRKFLPTHYRVENPDKCWLKFDALPIVIKETDKHVYQTFLF